MILDKLREALAELDSERAALAAQANALDEVESQIKAMIAKLGGDQNKTWTLEELISTSEAPHKDKIDIVADILRAEGRPLHITVIADRMSGILETAVNRTEVEPGLNRHISKVKNPRVQKFGPSIFGLPEWKGRISAPLLADQSTATH
jgi:hypothetical protein